MRPAAVTALLDRVLMEQQAVLGDHLLAVYLRGSLVTGDFDPASSDVDLFCVVEGPVTGADFDALAGMHRRLAQLPNPYAHELELAYLPRESARRWLPGERHPTLGRGEALEWREHGGNWLLERATLLRLGETLRGPPPGALLDAVSPEDIRNAVLERLKDWHAFALAPADPAWQAGTGHAAYCVETLCRALHTLVTGELGSKRAAVAWATREFPEPQRTLVGQISAWKARDTCDPEANRQAQAFIVWAVGEGGHGYGEAR